MTRSLDDQAAAGSAEPSADNVGQPRADVPEHHNERPTGMPPGGPDSSVSPPLPMRKKRGLNWDYA